MTRTAYLLQCLSEECAEVIQRVSKAQRFTLEEVQPGQDKPNSHRIIDELNDLFAVVQMLETEGVITPAMGLANYAAIIAKKAKVEKFIKYSAERGVVHS